MFGSRNGIAGRCIHHRHPTPGRSLKIDVVDTDSGSDDHLEPSLAIQCLGFQLGAAANDDPVGCRQGVSQVVAVQSISQVEVEMVMTTEYVKTGLGQRISDQNAEHGNSSARTPDTWSVHRRPNEPLE